MLILNKSSSLYSLYSPNDFLFLELHTTLARSVIRNVHGKVLSLSLSYSCLTVGRTRFYNCVLARCGFVFVVHRGLICERDTRTRRARPRSTVQGLCVSLASLGSRGFAPPARRARDYGRRSRSR